MGYCVASSFQILHHFVLVHNADFLHFVTADCTKVGDGNITADVTHDGLRFPCKVRRDSPGVYRIIFKPRGPGVYKIWINYDDMPVKGQFRAFLSPGRGGAGGGGGEGVVSRRRNESGSPYIYVRSNK